MKSAIKRNNPKVVPRFATVIEKMLTTAFETAFPKEQVIFIVIISVTPRNHFLTLCYYGNARIYLAQKY
jgi:hypothetical protein